MSYAINKKTGNSMSPKDLKELKQQARNAIKSKNFYQACALADQAMTLVPDDIRIHELDDYWYYCSQDMDEMERLRGRQQQLLISAVA